MTKNKLFAAAAAIFTFANISALTVCASDYPEPAMGLTIVSDGTKLYTTDGEIEEGKSYTFAADDIEFAKNGSNGFQALTFELRFSKESEYCTSVDDILDFAFEITSLRFNGTDVLNTNAAAYELKDSENGGFNLNDAIIGTAWADENEDLVKVKELEMTIKVTKFDPKNKKEDPSSAKDEESSSSLATVSDPSKTKPENETNPKTGNASLTFMTTAAALGAAMIVSKRK